MIAQPARTPQPQQSLAHVDQAVNNDQAPTNPAYLSEQNNNVAEQTIAALRANERDHAHPQAAATPQTAPGASTGSRDVRAGTQDHAGQQRPAQEASRAGGSQEAAGRTGQPGEASTTAPQPAVTPVVAQERPVMAASEGVWGQFALTPAQRGVAGTAGSRGGALGQGGSGGQGSAGNGQGLASASPSSSEYRNAFGAQVDQERIEAQQRRSQARGQTPAESWRELQAAVENYVPGVRVGNQTALRTAASPFSSYLTHMHRRIHESFADGFLAGLESAPRESPLNDPRLHTTVEIVLHPNGRIARIGIVRTSGSTMFDVSAINSIRRSAPFSEAPQAIRSSDGKVYIHWGFYRNERQCGTFNAEPFLVAAPASGSGPRERSPVSVPHAGSDR
ncbi:MAG: TonB family protein [Deltaproteobacteria bacterium]|nr:TonB family protein [Deltaproteobacteria bacterium]